MAVVPRSVSGTCQSPEPGSHIARPAVWIGSAAGARHVPGTGRAYGHGGGQPDQGGPPPSRLATPAVAAASTAAAVAARALFLALPRRGVLRPLDQLLRLDEQPVLVLRDQLQPDPAARLVDLLD